MQRTARDGFFLLIQHFYGNVCKVTSRPAHVKVRCVYQLSYLSLCLDCPFQNSSIQFDLATSPSSKSLDIYSVYLYQITKA